MRRLFALASASLMATTAIGQDIPAATAKDLWCGLAFAMAARDVPADAAPEILSVTEPYRQGAETLIGRAKAIYLEAGVTEEAFETLRAETEAGIAAELASTDPGIEPQYSFEDCAALIGL